MSVRIVDRAAKQLLKAAAQANVRIRVGVLGNEKHEGSKLTIARIFEIHELGLGVPERSVLRAWVDQNEKQIQADLRAALRKVLLGKLAPEQAAKILGVRFVAQIQEFIASGKVQPPLAEITIKRKGSSIPLIDTGQLKSAITYVVEKIMSKV